jgi:hypothetical protein
LSSSCLNVIPRARVGDNEFTSDRFIAILSKFRIIRRNQLFCSSGVKTPAQNETGRARAPKHNRVWTGSVTACPGFCAGNRLTTSLLECLLWTKFRKLLKYFTRPFAGGAETAISQTIPRNISSDADEVSAGARVLKAANAK